MSDRHEAESASIADRRRFLAAAGKFAVTVPPAMTLLLSTSMSSPAIAQSASLGGGDDDDALALLPLPLLAGLGGPGAAPVAAAPILAAAPAPAGGAPMFAAAPVGGAAPVTRVAPARSTPRTLKAGTPIQRAGERG